LYEDLLANWLDDQSLLRYAFSSDNAINHRVGSWWEFVAWLINTDEGWTFVKQ